VYRCHRGRAPFVHTRGGSNGFIQHPADSPRRHHVANCRQALLAAIHACHAEMTAIRHVYPVYGGGSRCNCIPQLQTGEYFFCPVGERDGTIIVTGLTAYFRLHRFDHGNTQLMAGQGTYQAGTHHATADNDDVILLHG